MLKFIAVIISVFILLPISTCHISDLNRHHHKHHFKNKGIGHSFLDVYMRIEPIDDFCGAKECNISYGISVLSAQNQFDLQSLMLQDGIMTRTETSYDERYQFEDSTVIRITKDFTHGKTFLGIRLFDVPDDIQDYIIVDVTNVISKNRKAKMHVLTDTVRIFVGVKQRTEEQLYKEYLKLKMLEAEKTEESLENKNSCSCSHKNCACCEHIKIRKLHLDDSLCVNVTYISEDVGIRFSMSVDNHIYYSKELSIKNPPPICYEVPHLREYASLCIQFYDVELKNKHFDGCIELEANLYHVKIAKRKLGCFKIPI